MISMNRSAVILDSSRRVSACSSQPIRRFHARLGRLTQRGAHKTDQVRQNIKRYYATEALVGIGHRTAMLYLFAARPF